MKDVSLYDINYEKYWRKVERLGDDDCWNWKGACNTGGYGLFSVRNIEQEYNRTGRTMSQLLAHRISAYVAYGNIVSKGVLVCHLCDNPRCCNPRHLYTGNQSDNMREAGAKGRHKGPIKIF